MKRPLLPLLGRLPSPVLLQPRILRRVCATGSPRLGPRHILLRCSTMTNAPRSRPRLRPWENKPHCWWIPIRSRSEEHTSELQSRGELVHLHTFPTRRSSDLAAAARASAIAGFASTSNLAAGLRYGIATAGTAAHSFTLLHDDERSAFQAQVEAMGKQTSLLVDTYKIDQGIRNAVEVAGPELAFVRIDSGDLLEEAHHARRLLDELGNTNTGIVVTSDLDEYAIAGLRSAPVDSYGVGTQLVTGSGAPTASLVYKLTTREDQHGNWVDVQKQAEGKASRGGRKYAARRMENGVATAEVVVTGEEPHWDANHRPLLIKVVDNGEIDARHTGATAVQDAAAHHKQAVTELPRDARRLQDGEPAIPTLFQLH